MIVKDSFYILGVVPILVIPFKAISGGKCDHCLGIDSLIAAHSQEIRDLVFPYLLS